MKDSFRYIFRPYELNRISLGILFGSLHRTQKKLVAEQASTDEFFGR